MFAFLLACARPSEPCPCADGHGVVLCDGDACTPCQCLPYAPATEDPVPAATRFVDADASGGDGSELNPWRVVDWAVLDRDVAAGHVLVVFDAGDTWPDPVAISRTDAGPHRVVLDGRLRRRDAGAWVDAEGSRAV